MQITIPAKFVKEAITTMVEGQIYDNFSPEVIKAAKVGKKADMVKAVMEDSKFMAGFERFLTNYISDIDVMVDAAYECDAKAVNAGIMACEKAYDAVDEELAIEREAQDLKRMVKVLEAAGFKVSKNG